MENLWYMSPAEELLWTLLFIVCLLSAVWMTTGGLGYSVLVFQRRFPLYGVIPFWILMLIAIISTIRIEWLTGFLIYCVFSPLPAIVLAVAIFLENRKRRRSVNPDKQVA